MGDELLCVLLLLNGLELLEQTLDERPAMLLEGNPKRLQPRVQSPWDTWTGWGKASGQVGGEGRRGEGRKQPRNRNIFILKLAVV